MKRGILPTLLAALLVLGTGGLRLAHEQLAHTPTSCCDHHHHCHADSEPAEQESEDQRGTEDECGICVLLTAGVVTGLPSCDAVAVVLPHGVALTTPDLAVVIADMRCEPARGPPDHALI